MVDPSGNIILLTSNGTFDGTANFGESFLKLSSSLALLDWFTPDDFANLTNNDLDLGSGGPLLVPGSNTVFGGGKDGTLYGVNTANMGHEWAGNTQAIQFFSVAPNVPVGYNNGGGIFSGPAYYNSAVYIWANAGQLSAFRFNGTSLNPTPVQQSSEIGPSNSYGAAIAVSASGSTPGTGVVWASMPSDPNTTEGGTSNGVLRAFDASNLTNELWNSNQNATRDGTGLWSKFRAPVVVNGKVYLGSVSNASQGIQASLSVYGLLSSGGSTGNGGGSSSTPTLMKLTITVDSNKNFVSAVETFSDGSTQNLTSLTTVVTAASCNSPNTLVNGVCTPPPCNAPNKMVNGVCAPPCNAPNTMVNGVCTPPSSGPITIAINPLPNAQVGVPYSYQLPITGGAPPYYVILAVGSWPPGTWSVSSTGLITGTPTQSWFSNLYFFVRDSNYVSPTNANQYGVAGGFTLTVQ